MKHSRLQKKAPSFSQKQLNFFTIIATTIFVAGIFYLVATGNLTITKSATGTAPTSITQTAAITLPKKPAQAIHAMLALAAPGAGQITGTCQLGQWAAIRNQSNRSTSQKKIFLRAFTAPRTKRFS